MSTATRTAPIHGVSGFIRRAVSSSLGAKIVMAATGLMFFGWLILHLAGNLGTFAGYETENTYAHFLKGNPEILWAQRLAWIVIFPIHILSGIRLTRLNRAARPEPYASPRKWRQASFASRSMALSGLIVLAFFIFHIAHFTWGGLANTYWADDHTDPVSKQADVFGMVLNAFHTPWIVAIYLTGVSLIGLHLSHGLWSGIQSLGLNGKKWTPVAMKLGFVLGVALAVGFALIPISVYFGAVHDDRPASMRATSGAPSPNERP